MLSLQLSFLSVLLLFLSSIAATSATSATSSSTTSAQLEILYWPLTNPQPSILAHVSYNPTSPKPELMSYTPPNAADRISQHDLVRVGLYLSTPTNPKQWVGTVTSLSTLQGTGAQRPTLRLHLSPATHDIYHVSLTTPESASASTSTSTSTSTEDNLPALDVVLVPGELGPSPHLNRPIVVGPDGKDSDEFVEKTLFQK
ncbi:hypothetical protein ARAM_006763 [Aspergillus rambellii]|uniref:Uncharacterized protein n=1 Tax=Aspergillus rambellii TaxID=308745 RepID=A0A0F8UIK4_9EURO|nr:hypothetical protein ARAM_006763 [Aspergillus rambellii]